MVFKEKSPLKYESHFIDIQGYKMHYLDEGQGEVVLLLHGNPTWCYYYRDVIEKLKSNFRVIAPDFIGMGLSDRLPKGVYLKAKDRMKQLNEFLDKLKIDRFSVVMHDWGGPIGTGMMAKRADKINKIVYLNTTLTETEILPKMIKKAASPVIGKIITRTTMRFLKWMTSFGVVKKLSKETCRGYYYPYKTKFRREAIWGFVKDIPFDESHPTYKEMFSLVDGVEKLQNVPVKIIWGLKDPCFHIGMLNKVIRLFPKAEVMEILDAGHLVLDDAKDTAIPAIEDFLINGPKKKESLQGEQIENPLVSNFINYARLNIRQDAIIESSFKGTYVSYSHTRYGELLNLVYSYQRGLQELGIRKDDKVIMLVMPGMEFLALSYSVMAVGAVPVFLDGGMGIENLSKCIESVEAKAMICSPKVHILRLLKKKIFNKIQITITASNSFLFSSPNLSNLKRFASVALPVEAPSDIALMAFTSGATGTPKGVVYTSKMLKTQLDIFKNSLGFKGGKKDCPLLPVFSLFTLALGVTSVFPPVNPSKPLTLDPEKIIRIINDLNIEYSFGAPSLWKKISEYAIRTKSSVNSLERIFMAGAPVPLEVGKNVKSIMSPNGEFFTPYGATEALPVTIITGKELLETKRETSKQNEQGVLVGKAAPDVSIKIIKNVKEEIEDISKAIELEPYTIGEVIVKGNNISPRYYKREDANKIAKIKDGTSFWHRMGDMGYLDKEGNLYFCGRKSEAVTFNNKTYYTVPTEEFFNEHKKVRRCALIKYKEAPAIVIEPLDNINEMSKDDKDNLIKELHEIANSHDVISGIDTFLFAKSFPVDPRHNAKIRRDKLTKMFEGK